MTTRRESRDFGQTKPISAPQAERRSARFSPNEANFRAEVERRTARIWPNEANRLPAAERRIARLWPNEPNLRAAAEQRNGLIHKALRPETPFRRPRRTNPIGDRSRAGRRGRDLSNANRPRVSGGGLGLPPPLKSAWSPGSTSTTVPAAPGADPGAVANPRSVVSSRPSPAPRLAAPTRQRPRFGFVGGAGRKVETDRGRLPSFEG